MSAPAFRPELQERVPAALRDTGLLSLMTLGAVQAEATRAARLHGDASMAGPGHGHAARFAIAAEEAAEASDEALALAVDLLARSGQLTGQLGRVARELNDAGLGTVPPADRVRRLYRELIQGAAMMATWAQILDEEDGTA
jgi:hypothetical protein